MIARVLDSLYSERQHEMCIEHYMRQLGDDERVRGGAGWGNVERRLNYDWSGSKRGSKS